jgi:hypothetical protein
MNADDHEPAIEAILAGTKSAMTGLPTLHHVRASHRLAAGDRFRVADSAGRPVAQPRRGGSPACRGWS